MTFAHAHNPFGGGLIGPEPAPQQTAGPLGLGDPTPAVDRPELFPDKSLPDPHTRPDLNARVYGMLASGAGWMAHSHLQTLYGLADSGLSNADLLDIVEQIRKLTVTGVQATALKPSVQPAQQGIKYQQGANKYLASQMGTRKEDLGESPLAGQQAGVTAAIHGTAAVSAAQDLIQKADDGFKHFQDDPVLQKHPSAGLIVQRYLSTVLGPAPVAGDTLKHTQDQLQLMGFGRDLPVTGTMSPGWSGAFAQWKNSVFRSQLSGNKPGSISVDHALKALSAITPGEAWPAMWNWVTHLPDAGRQIVADLAGGVAGAVNMITTNPRIPFISEASEGENKAFGQTAAAVTNALGGDTSVKEQTNVARNPGAHILEDGMNIIMLSSVLGAGSDLWNAAGMERLATTNPEAAAALTKDAAFRGPGVIARTLATDTPGTSVFSNLPILKSIGPVVDRIAGEKGEYYAMRSFTHQPWTWVAGEGGATATQGAIGSAIRLSDVAFQKSLLLGAEARGMGQIEQTLTGDENAAFAKNINKTTPVDELNDALKTFNVAGTHPLSLDDLMFVFGGQGARALHEASSDTIGATAVALQKNMMSALHEVGISEGVSRLYKGKSIVRISKEFGGSDNFATFIWSKIYDQAAMFAAQNEYDAKLASDGLPSISSSERIARIRDRANELRDDPVVLHKALSDMLSQGGGNELYVRLHYDKINTPAEWDPATVKDYLGASNHARDNILPWADVPMHTEIEGDWYLPQGLNPPEPTTKSLPTALGIEPKVLDYNAYNEEGQRDLYKGLADDKVRLFRGEKRMSQDLDPYAPGISEEERTSRLERIQIYGEGSDSPGRWWTLDPGYARGFQTSSGEITYIDVDASQLEHFMDVTENDPIKLQAPGGHDFDTLKAQQVEDASKSMVSSYSSAFISPSAERAKTFVPNEPITEATADQEWLQHPPTINAEAMFPAGGARSTYGIIPKENATIQSADEFNTRMEAQLKSIRARQAYNPNEQLYAERQTSVGEEHINPATPSPGPKPTHQELYDWNKAMDDHLHDVYGIYGTAMPQVWEDKIRVSKELAQAHLPLKLLAHPDAPPALAAAMDRLDEMGFQLVNAKDIGHKIQDIGPMEQLKGGLTFRRRLAENIGLNPDNINDMTIGQEAQNQILQEVKKAVDKKGVRLGPGQTPDSILAILRSHGVLPEQDALKGKIAALFNRKTRLENLLGRAEEEVQTQLPLRDARRKAIVKALMDPEIMASRDPANYDLWNMALTRDNVTEIPPWMSERDANLVAQAIVKGYSKVPTAFVGLNHLEDMFRGIQFMGLGMENKLGYALANLPNKLVQLRNNIRFDLSPMFDFRRVFKTNVKMAAMDITPSWDPIKALVDGGQWEEARSILAEVRPSQFKAEALGYADNADRYLASEGVFHYNQLGYETWAAYQMKQQGLTNSEIDANLTKLFQYGSRSGMERSANFLFFPFSFEKALYKVMGAYILDRPAQRLILTHAMAAYDQFNREHMDGSNPLATSFYNKHAPLFAEASRINAFTAGISAGEPGGINRPLLNLFLPQSWTPTAKSQDLLQEFIPALKDFSRIYKESLETGTIAGRWAQNLYNDYSPVQLPGLKAPAAATIGNPRQSTLTAAEDLTAGFQMYLDLHKAYAKNIEAGDKIPTDPQWGEFSGKVLTNQVLRQIVQKAHPAYTAEGAATYVITANQKFDDYLNTLRGTPGADGKFHNPAKLPDGTPAYKYISDFKDEVNSLGYELNNTTNPSSPELAKRTENLREVAQYLAENDSQFYKLYPKTFGRVLGPLEAVK